MPMPETLCSENFRSSPAERPQRFPKAHIAKSTDKSRAMTGLPTKSPTLPQSCSLACRSSTTVPASSNMTGSSTVKIVRPNVGKVCPADTDGVNSGVATSTRLTASLAKNGPAIAATGIPSTKAQRMTLPMSACRASMAMTGPGCGGIRPCMTERNDSSGSTSRRNGWPVSLARVMTIGRMSRRPTANQVVMPTQSASRMMHRPIREGPSVRMNCLASTPAPPDSARSLPKTTPSTMIAPVPAKVLPKPVWKAFRTSAIVSAPDVATTMAPSDSELISSAMNGLSFSQVTNRTRTAMASRA